MAVYATTMQAMNHLKRAVHELIKLKPDGSFDGTQHHVVGYDIPREWSMAGATAAVELRSVALPARERDRQLYSTGALSYCRLPCVASSEGDNRLPQQGGTGAAGVGVIVQIQLWDPGPLIETVRPIPPAVLGAGVFGVPSIEARSRSYRPTAASRS